MDDGVGKEIVIKFGVEEIKEAVVEIEENGSGRMVHRWANKVGEVSANIFPVNRALRIKSKNTVVTIVTDKT